MTLRQVTVFGGSGFVGRYIVRRLARQGVRVRAAVRHPELADFLKPMGDVGQVVPVPANVRHAGSVAAAIAGSDAVVNAAGIFSEWGRQRYMAVHAQGARTIAEAASAAGVRALVHISGIGAQDHDSPSRYVRSKSAAETAIREGFPGATILRPSAIFGPEDSLFNRFAALAAGLPVMPVIGGGRTRLQPVYVDDVAQAALRCLSDDSKAGATYELGGPRVYTLREAMELAMKACGREKRMVYFPFALAKLMGLVVQFLPNPPLTFDQAYLLELDNVVSPGSLGFAELGIEPTAAEAILPTYMDRYRVGGRYTAGTL